MNSKYNTHLMTTIANQIPTMSSTEAARQIEMFRQTMDGLRRIASSYAADSAEYANAAASIREVMKLNSLCCKRFAVAQSEEFRAEIAAM